MEAHFLTQSRAAGILDKPYDLRIRGSYTQKQKHNFNIKLVVIKHLSSIYRDPVKRQATL